MAEPRDSMLDPKYLGGLIGGKGYAFQNAYLLYRLPDKIGVLCDAKLVRIWDTVAASNRVIAVQQWGSADARGTVGRLGDSTKRRLKPECRQD